MNILVTGAKGFIGKNLIAHLRVVSSHNIYEYDIDSDDTLLDTYVRDCEFVFHLAGINRPKDEDEFMEGNYGFTSVLLEALKKYNNKSPVLITSSIQAELDNSYGRSKKAAEDILFTYGKETGAKVLIYRLPNVFGKWCRPNYNSAVATFCHNIANNLDIKVNDPNVIMKLVYIDDVIEEFLSALIGKENKKDAYCYVDKVYTEALGRIVELIYSFKNSRNDLSIPDMSNELVKKLYSTYLSYLPADQFSYPLKAHSDERGSFTEFIRTADRGQVSVNVAKPGITKGNHWHHTKNEKFMVVSGKGLIHFRKIDSSEIMEYYVSGDKPEVVDIPVGYTHNITNIGDTDLVTVMWANEEFNPENPDTYYLEVNDSRKDGIHYE